MIIGVSIDEVLRDFIGKFRSTYEKVFETEIVESTTSFDLMSQFSFETEDQFNNFMYEEFSLELFGHANEVYRAAMVDLNKLYDKYKDKHNIIIISKEHGNSIPASLFFLSKTSCKIRNFKFITSNVDSWNHCDVMITANPEILLSTPENKTSIKIKSSYNELNNGTYEYNKLKDLLDSDVLDNLFNSKIISYTNL